MSRNSHTPASVGSETSGNPPRPGAGNRGRRSKRPDLASAGVQLEPTFSPREIGAHLGLGHNAVAELIAFGRTYGAKLHPQRGGLYPTFKGAKLRRVPLSALDRHKRHMARINGDTEPPPTVVIGGQLLHSAAA